MIFAGIAKLLRPVRQIPTQCQSIMQHHAGPMLYNETLLLNGWQDRRDKLARHWRRIVEVHVADPRHDHIVVSNCMLYVQRVKRVACHSCKKFVRDLRVCSVNKGSYTVAKGERLLDYLASAHTVGSEYDYVGHD